MFIKITKHCEEQIKKRVGKDKQWAIDLFRDIYKAYKNKEKFEGSKVNLYPDHNTYGDVYKIVSGKYGFVYEKGIGEAIIITFLIKEKRICVGGKFYNLNN